MSKREPSKLEMQVLSVLWQRGPSTVREVLEAMPDQKERAYTTILSVMQVMEKKGFLAHTTQGNAHIYRPLLSRQQVGRPLLKGILSQVFGGSAVTVLQHLLAENKVSQEELTEIKELIASHEKRQASGNRSSRKSTK